MEQSEKVAWKHVYYHVYSKGIQAKGIWNSIRGKADRKEEEKEEGIAKVFNLDNRNGRWSRTHYQEKKMEESK